MKTKRYRKVKMSYDLFGILREKCDRRKLEARQCVCVRGRKHPTPGTGSWGDGVPACRGEGIGKVVGTAEPLFLWRHGSICNDATDSLQHAMVFMSSDTILASNISNM